MASVRKVRALAPVGITNPDKENRKNYVMAKSTPILTLTQSGPMAVLLQRQRDAVIQLDRHAHRKHMRAAFWKTLTWPFRALTARTLVDYTGRRQQIHDDLRIQHPEWVEANGESSMRLLEQLDTLTRRGPNESIAAPQRALEEELNEWPGAGTLNEWPGAGTTKAVFDTT
jgi:hypothetical protein